MNLITILSLFTSACFMFYGFNCLFSKQMKIEFARFQIPQFKNLTGVLQIIAGIGLLIGLYQSNLLAFIATTGLSLLMLMGFLVRLKIKDSFLLSAPSFIFVLINVYLAYQFYVLL